MEAAADGLHHDLWTVRQRGAHAVGDHRARRRAAGSVGHVEADQPPGRRRLARRFRRRAGGRRHRAHRPPGSGLVVLLPARDLGGDPRRRRRVGGRPPARPPPPPGLPDHGRRRPHPSRVVAVPGSLRDLAVVPRTGVQEPGHAPDPGRRARRAAHRLVRPTVDHHRSALPGRDTCGRLQRPSGLRRAAVHPGPRRPRPAAPGPHPGRGGGGDQMGARPRPRHPRHRGGHRRLVGGGRRRDARRLSGPGALLPPGGGPHHGARCGRARRAGPARRRAGRLAAPPRGGGRRRCPGRGLHPVQHHADQRRAGRRALRLRRASTCSTRSARRWPRRAGRRACSRARRASPRSITRRKPRWPSSSA